MTKKTWKEQKFSDLVDFPPKVSLTKNKEYSFIPMENVSSSTRTPKVEAKIYTGGGAKFCEKDTIFARITPCLENGKIAQIPKMQTKEGFGSTEYFVFRAKEGVSDPAFIYYLAKSDIIRQPAIKSMYGASGRQRADAAAVADIDIYAPPLETQILIGKILSAYDDLIENNQRRIRILEDMAQSLYREWFVHFRFPGHEKIKLIDSPLGSIPQGWEVRELKQCVNFVKEATKPECLKPHYKYLPIDCLPRKNLSVSEYRPLEEAQSSLVLFKREDILFGAMRSYFHKVVIAPFDGVTRATCFVFRPLKEEYRCWSLLRLFQDETVDYASAHSKGATIPYASWEDGMARMPTVFPPPEIAKKFEEAISSSVDWIINAHHRQESLKNARDLLLPKLISGEINLSVSSDLLEKAA